MRDYIRLYCHLGGGKMEDFYETRPADAQRFAELAQQAVADGFTAFKSMAVPETMPLEGLRPIRYAEACVRAMREAVGDDIDIMVDCHARPSPRMGLRFAKALEPYGLYFFEEPCWPETHRRHRPDPAGGEHAHRHGRAAGQPARFPRSAGEAGLQRPAAGHHALRRPERSAAHRGHGRAYRVALAPHNPQGPVSTAASLEFGFATPSLHHLRIGAPRRALASGRRPRGLHGREEGPARAARQPPGLGIEIDEAEVKKHPFQQEVLQRSFYADGAVGDW